MSMERELLLDLVLLDLLRVGCLDGLLRETVHGVIDQLVLLFEVEGVVRCRHVYVL